MEECINNVITDYYKLDKKSSNETTTTTPSKKDSNGYDLERKIKSSTKLDEESSSKSDRASYVNHCFENENETTFN